MFKPSPLLVVTAIAILSVMVGSFLARTWRMKEVGWKLILILLSFSLAVAVLIMGTPSLGIDLRGGNILIYEIDAQKTRQAMESDRAAESPDADPNAAGQPLVDMAALIQSLQRRINPGGVREIVIREYGTDQIEIIIPEVAESEIETIKEAIRKTGFLKFRIVADKTRHPHLWQLGEEQMASKDEAERFSTFLRDGDKIVGEWVKLGREDVTTPGEVPPYRMNLDFVKGEMLWREVVPDQIEILTVLSEENNVEGSDLAAVNRGVDEYGSPSVDFAMTSDGAIRMGRLTGTNAPDPQTGNEAKLGIILDNELLSCPGIRSQISTHGTIEGRFSEKEVNTLIRVLRDGKMPAVLFPEPISQSNISPLLGIDTIRKGAMATIVSLILVILFMLWYYRFAGLIACIALVGNLVLTVATMILISASFTLPGIAGLVLTVGMSVDANVLIYERIREELKRGASLRMALRNGFERATTTIIDSNVTTIIVAVVLYLIGTADLRGFAVSLITGIVMSMYTAIFCSRTFFDIAERKRWLKQLRFREFMTTTHIPFLKLGPPTIAASVIVILVGFLGVYIRGNRLFDIDFLGGSAVQIVLKEPMPIEEVRDKLRTIAEDVWVTQINPQDQRPNTVFKVDTSLQDEQELHDRIQKTMKVGESGLLATRSMEFTTVSKFEPAAPAVEGVGGLFPARGQPTSLVWARDPQFIASQLADQQEKPSDGAADSDTQRPPAETDNPTEAAEGDTPPAADQPQNAQGGNPPAADREQVAEEAPATEEAAPEANQESAPPPTDAPRDDESVASETAGAYQSVSRLTFQDKTSARTVQRLIDAAAQRLAMTAPRLRLSNPNWDGRSDTAFREWDVAFTSSPENTQRILADVKAQIGDLPIWLSSNKIGGKIAGSMRGKALQAIFWSLVAIIIYIWFRFRNVAYGLAAVIAVIHDVMVTLGFIALSTWLAPSTGALLVEEFKVSLPIVAALLTIIGYSLNDTIVIFDRIREIKGKSPDVTNEMVDSAVNQTLSRTILTFFTTFIVVVVLYAFGGEGIHGFAFALLIGVVAGVYSTAFIACPILMWMLRWWKARQAARSGRAAVAVR